MDRRPNSRLRGSQRYRRVAALMLGATGLAMLGAPLSAGAQEANSDEVVRGAATASADSMSFLIINGGASLGWTFGRSTAAYRDITTTAEGKSIDLGALAPLLTQPQCDGQFPPVLNTETLPARTIAESFGSGPQGPYSEDVNYPLANSDKASPKALGTQQASTTDVRSESNTTTVNQDFGFFRVSGAASRAWTSFENGVRSAHAEFSARSIHLLGGLVTFIEPRWTASASSGSEQSEDGGFTFRSASVFGNWISGATLDRDLGIFETLVEGILSPLGLDIVFPNVTQPASGDGIVVTPMAINMENAPIGNDLLIPLLNTDLLKQYRIDSVDEDCKRESFWTIIDAVERALGGAGSLETLIGGAEATTDSTDYSYTPVDFGDDEIPETPAVEIPPPSDPPEDDFGDDGLGDGFDDFSDDGFGDFGDEGFADDFSEGGFEDDFGDDGFESAEGDVSFEAAADETTPDAVDPDAEEDIADSSERASADDGGSDAAGDAAAITLGVLALLGALGLSLGDRVMGLRSQHMIEDSDE